MVLRSSRVDVTSVVVRASTVDVTRAVLVNSVVATAVLLHCASLFVLVKHTWLAAQQS